MYLLFLDCCFVKLISYSYFTATIFAYGQTSSGKTYTMRGITEKAVYDIYRHIFDVSFITFSCSTDFILINVNLMFAKKKKKMNNELYNEKKSDLLRSSVKTLAHQRQLHKCVVHVDLIYSFSA